MVGRASAPVRAIGFFIKLHDSTHINLYVLFQQRFPFILGYTFKFTRVSPLHYGSLVIAARVLVESSTYKSTSEAPSKIGRRLLIHVPSIVSYQLSSVILSQGSCQSSRYSCDGSGTHLPKACTCRMLKS